MPSRDFIHADDETEAKESYDQYLTLNSTQITTQYAARVQILHTALGGHSGENVFLNI